MKRYCTRCGTALQRTLVPANEYDTYTGKRVSFVHYKCPNKRWWTLRHNEFDGSNPTQEKPSETQG